MAEPVFYPKFSDEEVRSRWRKVRDAMDAAHFDGLLVYGSYFFKCLSAIVLKC